MWSENERKKVWKNRNKMHWNWLIAANCFLKIQIIWVTWIVMTCHQFHSQVLKSENWTANVKSFFGRVYMQIRSAEMEIKWGENWKFLYNSLFESRRACACAHQCLKRRAAATIKLIEIEALIACDAFVLTAKTDSPAITIRFYYCIRLRYTSNTAQSCIFPFFLSFLKFIFDSSTPVKKKINLQRVINGLGDSESMHGSC